MNNLITYSKKDKNELKNKLSLIKQQKKHKLYQLKNILYMKLCVIRLIYEGQRQFKKYLWLVSMLLVVVSRSLPTNRSYAACVWVYKRVELAIYIKRSLLLLLLFVSYFASKQLIGFHFALFVRSRCAWSHKHNKLCSNNNYRAPCSRQ